MNFLNNEKGVSEVIGALLIFLILVIVLGSIQVYEVPKWNKELEKQNFDIVSAEFIDMKSDLEDVSIHFVPKTSSLHMGVKYPERFMLRNPGPAYGTLSNYPLKIMVNITLDSGEIVPFNFSTNGIEYELNGISNQPKLVYEHGIVLKDFGENNFPEDLSQSLLIKDEFFIPILNSSVTLSSIDTEPINLKPLNLTIFNTTNNIGVEFNITRINISMETNYNESWKELITKYNKTNILHIEGNQIKISINSSSKKYFVYPEENTDKDSFNLGMLMFTSNYKTLTSVMNQFGGGGNTYNDYGSSTYNNNTNNYTTVNIFSSGPPFTTINISKPNYPFISNIQIESSDGIPNYRKTHVNITATVFNVTNLSSIRADLTGLQRDVNPMAFSVPPDIVLGTPDWSLGKTNVVRWSNIQQPDYGQGANVPIVVGFWVSNDVNGLYYTVRAYIYQGGTSWYS